MINCKIQQCEVFVFDENVEFVNALVQECHIKNSGMRTFGTSSPTIALSSLVGGLFQQKRVLYNKDTTIVASDTPWGIYFLRQARMRCANAHTILLSGISTAEQIQNFLDEKLICHFVAKDGYSEKPIKFVNNLAEVIVKITREFYPGNVPNGHAWHAFRAFVQCWIRSLPEGVNTMMSNFEGKTVKVTEALTNPVFFRQLFINSSFC